MAGHSKWANIRFRKAAQDAKRGKLFTKFIREITVAARAGGAETDNNPRLRAAIDKALGNNMSRDVINKAVKRGAGGLEGDNVEELTYEGYGPNGVAIMVQCMTDNRNRTVAEVRHCFNKYGGNLGTDGSVSYLFSKQGFICFENISDEEKLMDIALESGADDFVVNDDNTIDVITNPENFGPIQDKIIQAGFAPTRAEVSLVASTQIACDAEITEKLMRLVDALEDLDDVQEVHTNADITLSDSGD